MLPMPAPRKVRKPTKPLAATLCLFLAIVLAAGCGSGPAVSSTSVSIPTPTSIASSTNTSTSVPQNVGALFAGLAQSAAPMAVFAPTLLPEDTRLAAHWLPVIDSDEPEEYDGPLVANPRVMGTGTVSVIQVVFQTGDGWLVVVENFRGDLGDVSGIEAGSVAGNPAVLYEVNGGELVQWSRDGLWYGVFGREVARDELIATALGMQPTPPPTT
jgi:hypothetical protein